MRPISSFEATVTDMFMRIVLKLKLYNIIFKMFSYEIGIRTYTYIIFEILLY